MMDVTQEPTMTDRAGLVEKVAIAIGQTEVGETVFADRKYIKGDEIVIEPFVRWYYPSARAAITVTLDEIERHLSAVQYDPAPYTALKHRLATLRREALG